MMMKVWMFFVLALSALSATTSCETDSDCLDLHTCEGGTCERKGLLPLEAPEIAGFLLILVFSSLANAGGIGGGQIMVPLLLLLFYFDTHDAIPLSQSIIAGGSFTSIALKVFMRHPTKNRPLIYYTLMMHMQSTLLLGTTYGVILNTMFPPWLILALLTLILIYISYTSGKKGWKLFQKEKEALRQQASIQPAIIVTHQNPEENYLNNKIIDSKVGLDQMEIKRKLTKIYTSESRTIECFPFSMMIIIYLVVVLASFMKGDKGLDSIIGLEHCSTGFWVFIIVFSLLMIGINCLTGAYLYKHTQERLQLSYDYDDHDILWTLRNIIMISSVGFLAGLCASLLGIGGGTFISPVMLVLNVRPEVSAATSSFMVFFTSSISLIQYASADKLIIPYAITLICIAFFGAIIGVFGIQRIVKYYKRSSLLVLALVIILLVATILVPYYGIVTFVKEVDDGTMEYGLAGYC